MLIATLSPQAIAAPTKAATRSKGLTLSPLRSELGVAPGSSQEGVLTITNSTKEAMTVHLSAEKFSVINQQYDYAFSADSDTTKWVTFDPETIDLATGETKQASFRLGVPLTAEPGGRYLSLFVSTDTKTDDGGVRSRQRVASLIYLNVLGDVSRSGHLISLSSPWVVAKASTWSAAIRNSGTTHFRSRHHVSVKNIFTHDEIVSATGDDLILPGTVRAVVGELPTPPLPGVYQVVHTVGLGDTPAVTETRLLFYLPVGALLVIVGIAGAIVLLVVYRRGRKH